MIFDRETCFNTVTSAGMTAQAETAADTQISANVLDWTKIPRTQFSSLFFVVQIVVIPISAGGGTWQIDLVSSAAEALSTPTIAWSSGLLANATIVAYAANSIIYALQIPPRFPLRYVGVRYTIATDVWTAGSFCSWLTPNAPYGTPATP